MGDVLVSWSGCMLRPFFAAVGGYNAASNLAEEVGALLY